VAACFVPPVDNNNDNENDGWMEGIIEMRLE
jgi:hypothetical protein